MTESRKYDRHSLTGLTMKTANSCNDFIIDYLMRNKIKSSQKVFTNQVYMYNWAIESVRKYPMPLLYTEQLQSLQGFGDFFVTLVSKLIKKHYLRGRMPTQEEMEQDDKEHLQTIQRNHTIRRNKIQKREFQAQQKLQKQEQVKQRMDKIRNDLMLLNQDAEIDSLCMSDEISSLFSQNQIDEHFSLSKRSSKSQINKKQMRKYEKIMEEQNEVKLWDELTPHQKRKPYGDQNYQLRKGTEPTAILRALVECQADLAPVSLGDLNQHLFNKRKDKVRGWTHIRPRLRGAGYITLNEKNHHLISITEKGKKAVLRIEEKLKRQKQIERGERKKYQRKNKNQQQSSLGRISSSINFDTSSKNEYDKHSQKSENIIKVQKMKKQLLSADKKYGKVQLLVNLRSSANIEDRLIIAQLLKQSQAYNFIEEDLEVGEFGWIIEDKLLDCFAFRFKVQQFDVDQFYLTCRKMRYVECQCVILIFQMPLCQAKHDEQIMNKMYSCSRLYGFKVFKSRGIIETMTFMIKVMNQFNYKLKKLNRFTSLFFIGNRNQLNSKMKQFDQFNLNVTQNILKLIPLLTNPMIKRITQKMPHICDFYDKLKKLETNDDKSDFLFWFLQQFRPKRGTVSSLIKLLFSQEYESHDAMQSI